MKLASRKLFFALCTVALLSACGGGADSSSTEEPVVADATSETPATETTEAPAGAATYVVNKGLSEMHWRGEKVGGFHEGLVGIQSGTFEFDGEQLKGGEIVLDMTDIVCTDLEGEDAADLEGHLKNEDFFDSENHPTATFTIDWVKDRGKFIEGGQVWQVKGDLTIKGQTAPNGATAVITREGNGFRLRDGEMEFDRTAYGITYKSKSILGDAADKFIHDNVNVTFTLVLDPAE